MQNKVKEKDRKHKADKRLQMNEKEDKQDRCRTTESNKKPKKTTTPIKIFKTAQSLGKARNCVNKFLLLLPCHKK